MVGAEADEVEYEWTIGTTYYADSASITVPLGTEAGTVITVTVTDDEGNEASDSVIVVEEAIVSEVKLDNITPAVGDMITAFAYDADGEDVSDECTWQWFRVTPEGNVVKISNATKQSYIVGAIDRNAVLYCEATDANGNLLKSDESSVMKATNITQINVTGMTGQRPGDKAKFVAVAGDELTVELEPFGASLDAEYQWYRGGAAIKGATEGTYIPTTADVNLQLSVKVKIPSTAGYGISTDATTTNESLAYGTVVNGTTYSLEALVTLDDVVCWDLSNSTVLLDVKTPAVGDTITAKVPFDKNGDGDEEDSGDYLDLTSDDPDATVAWYRGSIEAKNWLADGASYDVVKEDNGSALYVVVTGAEGTEFISSCQGTTDDTNKTVMNTTITRETPTVAVDTDMVAGDAAMTKGTKLYATTKDNNNDSVKDANLTFQWYRGGAAIDGATSSSYTIGDDDLKKFKNATNNLVTYRVVVTGKDGYVGSAKDTIDVKGAIADTTKQTKEDISVKRGDYYLANGDVVNAGDALTLAASYADSLNAMNVVWWYTANGLGTDVEQFTGTSFTVPSDAGTDAKISVSLTLKDDPGMWSDLTFTTCTTNTSTDTDKTSDLTTNLTTGTTKVVYAGATVPANWAALTTTVNGTLSCAKALASIDVTYKVGDRTLTAPEVGATMTVTVKPQLADLTYEWKVGDTRVDSNDDGDTITAAETGENANSYTIKRADVNKKITVKATAGAGSATYEGASIKLETAEVAASSRTINAVKVLKYDNSGTKGTSTDTWYVDTDDVEDDSDFLNTKADFINKKSVSAITTGNTYIIVAMDSDGEIIDSDVSYNLYDFKSGVEKKVGSAQRFYGGTYFAVGDVPHFEVVPNQVGYTGDAVSYNLSSAVSYSGGTIIPDAIALTIAPATTVANAYDEDLLIVAKGESVKFEATVEGVDGNPSIKWFDGTGKQVKVGATYDPKALTNGDSFYAEMTVDGTTYTSDAWEVQARVATTFAVTTTTDNQTQDIAIATSGTAVASTNVMVTATDQFGEEVAAGDVDVNAFVVARTAHANGMTCAIEIENGKVKLTVTNGPDSFGTTVPAGSTLFETTKDGIKYTVKNKADIASTTAAADGAARTYSVTVSTADAG